MAALALAAAAAAGPAPGARPAPAVDLEVGVPPGSPLDWGRAFPALTPGRGPLFPTTPGGTPAAGDAEGRTEARPRAIEMELRLGSSFGLVRILTWDLTAHVDWMRGVERLPRPTGTAGGEAPFPAPGEPLYWIALAPLLRLWLHPQTVSRAETIAHLVELGAPSLVALGSARGEPGLQQACEEVAERVVQKRVFPPQPLERRTPRETMLSRFVLDELRRAHPYDPAGGFGARIFVLYEELEPLVAAYLDHPDPFTRRNAAAALGRYRSRLAYERLLRAALSSDDAVVRLRALAALPDQPGARSAGPLIERALETRDEVERVALVGALGRLGGDDGVPALLKLAGRGLRGDPDLVVAALTALARVPYTAHAEEAQELLARVESAARRRVGALRQRAASPSVAPDLPDPPERRPELVRQLALLARFGLDRGDARLVEELLALTSAPGPSMIGSSPDLGAVLPPAQLLYVDALSELGEPGRARLLAIVEGTANDASLRGRALARLPWSERRERAPELALDLAAEGELRVHALEAMVADRHPELEATARALLERGLERGPGGGSAVQRHLQLVALRALAERRLLGAVDLLPLLAHPRGDGARIDTLRAEVEAQVRALVEARAAGRSRDAIRERVAALLDALDERRVRRHLEGRSREEVERHVVGLVEGVRGRGRDQQYVGAVVAAVMEYLLGFVAPSAPGDPSALEAAVPLEEEVLFALGRTRAPEAVDALAAFLEDRENGYRAHACLALGMAGDPAAAVHLVPLLMDPDGFVRFCAAESLRHLTGEDLSVDWMYGARADWTRAAGEYARWCRERR